MTHKVVVHFRDGSVTKGTTADFSPHQPAFHLRAAGLTGIRQIPLSNLKAIFFVRDFVGRPGYRESKKFPTDLDSRLGDPLCAFCEDGEAIVGYCRSYHPDRPGFFLVPPDPAGNNERIYLFAEAVTRIEPLRTKDAREEAGSAAPLW
jgi:Family of unknown function (DUF6982)